MRAQVFLDLDFTLMEMNPFTLDAAGFPFPLDMRGELDDTAAFKSGKKCAAPCPCTTPALWPFPLLAARSNRGQACSCVR
jgi:succinyl-CoA synthetase beta subunit